MLQAFTKGGNISVAVRTLLVTVSPLLAGLIVGVLEPHLRLDIIGSLDSRDGVAEQLRELAPALVIVGLIDSETDACALPMLNVLPAAEILVLATNGQHAWVHEMRPHRIALPDLSAATLVRALLRRLTGDPRKG